MQQLLFKGNSKLTDALKKKDNTQVVVAQAMLCSASSKLSITRTEMTDIMPVLYSIKKPAEHESVDQRTKKHTVKTTDKSTREWATCVLSKSKIPATGESSKSDTKRPAVSRSDGIVPAAKERALNISETGVKKSVASGLNKSEAKTSIAGELSKPRTGEISCELESYKVD